MNTKITVTLTVIIVIFIAASANILKAIPGDITDSGVNDIYSPEFASAYEKEIGNSDDPLKTINENKDLFESFIRGRYSLDVKLIGEIKAVDFDNKTIYTEKAMIDFKEFNDKKIFNKIKKITIEEDGSISVLYNDQYINFMAEAEIGNGGEIFLLPRKDGLILNDMMIHTQKQLEITDDWTNVKMIIENASIEQLKRSARRYKIDAESTDVMIIGYGMLEKGRLIIENDDFFLADEAIFERMNISIGEEPVKLMIEKMNAPGISEKDYIYINSNAEEEKIVKKMEISGDNVEIEFLPGNRYFFIREDGKLKIETREDGITVVETTTMLGEDGTEYMSDATKISVYGQRISGDDMFPIEWGVIINGKNKIIYTERGAEYDLAYYDKNFDVMHHGVATELYIYDNEGNNMMSFGSENYKFVYDIRGEMTIARIDCNVSLQGFIQC